MNLFDRAWHYTPGPKGPIKRCAIVTEACDRPEAAHLTVFALADSDKNLPPVTACRYVPIRRDYAGGPIDTAFCTPVDPRPSPKLAGRGKVG